MTLIKRLRLLVLLTVVSSCVEDFEFDVPSDIQGIVVEGSISNLSYFDLDSRPTDPRLFELSLKYTSRVTNVRDELISGAQVELHNSNGEVYDYAEYSEGRYALFYGEIKAMPDTEYWVEIELQNGIRIESEREVLPAAMPIGELSVEELTKSISKQIDGEITIFEEEGINLNLRTITNETEDPVYYRWDFVTTWIHNAFLANRTSPVKFCWATSEYHFEEYELLKDYAGGSASSLFFLKTDNSLLNEGFSVLVKQSILSQEYYEFVDGIKDQKEQSELFATPPYNLETNLRSDDIAVFGYFSVVNESMERWYFDKDEVSNYGGYKDGEGCDMDAVPPPYPDYCYSCLNYSVIGTITNEEPDWWDPKYRP